MRTHDLDLVLQLDVPNVRAALTDFQNLGHRPILPVVIHDPGSKP